MSDAIHDPHAYTRLTDDIISQILVEKDRNLEKVCFQRVLHSGICLRHENDLSASALPMGKTAKTQRSSRTLGKKIGSAS